MREAVVQQHEFGCGAACVAVVARISYTQAVNLLGVEQASSSGFLCKELVAVLNNLDFPYECNYLKPKLRKKIYQEGVIVFIKRSKRYPAGHYLVRHNDQWMDPWINLPFEKNIERARASFRKRLPGRPIYMILPV